MSPRVQYCKDYMAHPANAKCLRLSKMVQYFTLEVSLYDLFDEEALGAGNEFDGIVAIRTQVDELWIGTKNEPAKRPKWEDQKVLHAALRRVLTPSPKMLDFLGAKEGRVHGGIADFISGAPGALQRMALNNHRTFSDRIWSKLIAAPTKSINTTIATVPEPTISALNPMNLIRPAYETMWRVVMRCFLEIRYRKAEQRPN